MRLSGENWSWDACGSEVITSRNKNRNCSIRPSLDSPLIRWSIQKIRRIAVRLEQRRIQPAYIIAWSLWRRAHQAARTARSFEMKHAIVILEC